MTTQLGGLFPVGVTPFDEQGLIDEDSLRRSVEFYIEAGVNGIAHVLGGSEYYTLSDQERRLVTRVVTETVGGRVPVMIGVAGVSSRHAVELARYAEECGANAVVSMPSYTRLAMSLAEIEGYFRAIGEAVSIPIVIQNAGTPFGVPMSADFVARLLREIEHVEYVKEETRNPGQMITAILQLAGDACKGVLGGAGGHYILDEYRRGSCGTMPFPHLPDIQAVLWRALEANDWEKARQIHYRMMPLYSMESRFGVVLCKEILHRRGVIATAATRAPSPPLLDAINQEELDTVLARLQDLLTCYLPKPGVTGSV